MIEEDLFCKIIIKMKWCNFININVEFKVGRIFGNKVGYFIMMKKLIQWGDIMIINVYLFNLIFLKNV